MSRSILTAGALALGLAASAAGAQPLPPAQPPGLHMQAMATPDFITAAGQSDQFEIQEGQIASRRALTPQVRQAALKMIHDHDESTQKMMAAAHRAGLPPMPPPGLDVAQQQMFERLKVTTGPAFDRLYVDQQVHAHQKALALMTGYVQSGQDGPIRQAAMQIRPVVQRHLAMWERLQSTMG